MQDLGIQWRQRHRVAQAVGEEDIVMQSTVLSIPWDVEALPVKDDEVVILSHHTDDKVVGKRYVIDSSSKAGDLRATRSFMLRGYQER